MFVCLSNAFTKDAKNRTRDQFHMRIRMELEGIVFHTHLYMYIYIYIHTYMYKHNYLCMHNYTVHCLNMDSYHFRVT